MTPEHDGGETPSFASREPFDGASLHDDTGRIRPVDEFVTVVVDAIVANFLNALVDDAVAVVVDPVVADFDGPAVAASHSVGGAVTIVIRQARLRAPAPR